MHLVAPLAAGIAGAENGTVELYRRGTTTPAYYYVDFEAAVTPPTGIVPLDSHGGAVIYTRELTNVIVKNAGGAVVREFVAGDRDDSVEVASDSFSGTSYDGAFSAPGQPTTLGNVLEMWKIMNGGIDWQIALPGGSVAPISTAIANGYGLVFNVRAHGAVGNGVANDASAINAAISAASAVGGGIVYFPPGTYRTSGNHVVRGDIALIGAGNTATSVVLDNFGAGRLFQLTASPSSDRFQVVANMRLASVALASSAAVFDFSAGARVLMSDMYLDGTNFPGHIVSATQTSTTEFIIATTVFQLGSTGRALTVSSSGTIKRGAFRDCRFIAPVSPAQTSFILGNFLDLTSCVFDNSAATTGAYSCLNQNATSINWNITGCTFGNAAGATVSAINIDGFGAAANIIESENTFGSTVTAYVYNITGSGSKGAQVRLKSREFRVLNVSDPTAAATPANIALPIDQYGMIVVTCASNTITLLASASRPPEGARGTIVLVHTGSGAATGTAIAGVNFMNPASAPTAANSTHLWEYRACMPVGTMRMALTVDGRNEGTGL